MSSGALGPKPKVYLDLNLYFGYAGAVEIFIRDRSLKFLIGGHLKPTKTSKEGVDSKNQTNCPITESSVQAVLPVGIFRGVFNVEVLQDANALHVVGGNTLADALCVQCGLLLGWRYIAVPQPSMSIRQGRFLMILHRLTYWNNDPLFPLHDVELEVVEENADQDGGANEHNDDQDGGANSEQNADQDVGVNNEQNADHYGGANNEQNADHYGGANEQNADHDGGAPMH
ncbi:hypothetical protein FXO38_02552 [Capsicum annuum]|nr:hypothetical protein FXO38_02552 [Capsicum annuum]KAF3682076.1 hypothetical protein FXO37_02553 [Capsicum annuum]